jgi:molybdopterin molybdotransferase
VLAVDVAATRDVPFYDRSTVDGFAVRSADVQDASPSRPIVLNVIGESKLGQLCRLKVKRSQGVAVATGSLLPYSADSVVPVEDTAHLSKQRISLTLPLVAKQNILHRGEDIPRGRVILRSGRRLRPQDLGLLRSLGFTSVRVVKRPKVGVLSTGSELAERVGRTYSGKVVDVNRLVLAVMVSDCGGDAVDFGIVKDRREQILDALGRGVKSCDLILISGGSSVGGRDLVPECINALGRPGMLVHGVAMRPAMPTGLAAVGHVPIISLPGIPVSAMFSFRVFGRPMIARIMGAEDLVEGTARARLAETVKGLEGCRTYVRVRLVRTKGCVLAEPLRTQKSSALASIVAADGYVVVPEGIDEIRRKSVVDVTLLR